MNLIREIYFDLGCAVHDLEWIKHQIETEQDTQAYDVKLRIDAIKTLGHKHYEEIQNLIKAEDRIITKNKSIIRTNNKLNNRATEIKISREAAEEKTEG